MEGPAILTMRGDETHIGVIKHGCQNGHWNIYRTLKKKADQRLIYILGKRVPEEQV